MEPLEKEAEEDSGKTNGSGCSEMKIKFENFQKSSKKLFKLTLPTDMLTTHNGNNGDNTCPVVFCRKSLPKNRSIEDHIREHLSFVFRELVTPCEIDEEPQFDVHYHCSVKDCKYSDENKKSFPKVKYLKQHYVKVHAPKDFRCSKCQKAFALQSYVESHEAMCGMMFTCSCGSSYTTLEALQTHLRRRKHSVDLTKYKELLSVEKSRIQEMKTTELVSNKESKSNICRSKGTITSVSSKSTAVVSQSEDQRRYGSSNKELPKKFVDFETQTGSQLKSSSGPKRKKSAETQTTRVRVRISTETQTTSVMKRRRSTRKKQSAEAQTQCHNEVSQNQRGGTNRVVEAQTECSPQINQSHDQGCQHDATSKVDMSVQAVVRESNPTLYSYEDSNIENPILEFDSDSFLKEMEVHMQTQTEPDLLLLDGDNIFSDYEVANLNDTDDFLNFVNTETQTANPSIVHNNFMEDFATDPFPDATNTNTTTLSGSFHSDEHFKTLNSSYLETIDNETQTQFYDFLSKMLE